MFRAFAVVALIVGLVAVLVFGPKLLFAPETEPASASGVACDLLAQDCSWESAGGSWQVSLRSLGEGDQGTEFLLKVNTTEKPERFLAVLRGESMYMGEYPVPLQRREENLWTARFTAPFCTTGSEMLWRIDFQSGQKKIGSPSEKLVFHAH